MSQSGAGEESDLGDPTASSVGEEDVFHDALEETDQHQHETNASHNLHHDHAHHHSLLHAYAHNHNGSDPAEHNVAAAVAGLDTSPIALPPSKTSTKKTLLPMSPIAPIADMTMTMTMTMTRTAAASKPGRSGSSSSRKSKKTEFPPPFPELVFGYHQNDVLSGRGATVNAHPGNRQFRDMCAERKPEFERATNSEKRRIALEIVERVLKWTPPGRFVERADDDARYYGPDDVDAFFATIDVDKLLTGANLVYFNSKGYTLKRNKRLKREFGPWRDMGIERAVQKACGVIRDYERPDRIALRAMGMLKRKSREDYLDEAHGLLNQDDTTMASTLGDAPTHDADDDDTVLNDDISSAYREIVVTPSDVLLGRGSFVNEHTGNRQFRIFALKRKAEFDEATPPARRDIAADLVNMTKDLDPPGRFLKRAPYALQEPVLLTDGKYQLPPRGLEGPWEAITLEQQWAKAMQVMRDLKPKIGDAPTHDAYDDDTVLNDDISSAYREIVVTPSDVLMGRGSFINEHTGNRQFRILALKRKAEFDEAIPPARRDIAADLVNMTKDLDPPGRFLKRAPYALQEPVLLPDGKYQLPPRGLEGPWEAITLEQQRAKAMQVMRDLKPKKADFVFEAEQVAALARVNASMKEKMVAEAEGAVEFARDTESEEAVAFARADNFIDAHHNVPGIPSMAEAGSDPLQGVIDDGIDHDIAEGHEEMPESPGMSQDGNDGIQVAEDEMKEAVVDDVHDEMSEPPAESEGTSYHLQVDEGETENNVGRTYV